VSQHRLGSTTHDDHLPWRHIIKAENDCVVAELPARPGDGLSVDQPILRFR
jgi:hypothetical protein